ncbi:MAG: hypothetical protein U5K43_02945 [Halofilum sp. (in: g-proteobacteria)]|nr:hypothetical protein [Halofilum sp. (in: g-proteobacteria)]
MWVTEPWARRFDAAVGDTVTLWTDRGERSVPIAGIYYDYNTERGIVLMHRDLYEQWWDSDRISALGVFLAAGADARRGHPARARAPRQRPRHR